MKTAAATSSTAGHGAAARADAANAAPATAANTVESSEMRLAIPGAATGGTYQVVVNGRPSADLPHDAALATVRAAVSALLSDLALAADLVTVEDEAGGGFRLTVRLPPGGAPAPTVSLTSPHRSGRRSG